MPDGRTPRYAGFGYRREFAMSAAEWVSATDPVAMLRHLGMDACPRKLRLFATACYRYVWKELGPRAREGLEVAEQFADGHASRHALAHHHTMLAEAYLERCATEDYATNAAWNAIQDLPVICWRGATSRVDLLGETCACLRDIFAPFRQASTSGVSSGAFALAQAAYDERRLPSGHLDPTRLAIVADALEEDGCDDGELLQHLRGPGPHVRGCWVVDLLLGKE